MRISIILILFCFAHGLMAQDFPFQNAGGLENEKIFNEKPDYFTMDWVKGTMLSAEEIEIDIDSLDLQRIDFLTDSKNQPILYSVKISTPVCADGECRLMDIRLYWDLLGNYAGFDKIEGLPLTKFEHEEFTESDYLKLHQLLQDQNSILGERSIDELVDKPSVSSTPEGVDAISGATIAEVKGSTIEGALYSCHVAWRLANGEIRGKLKAHTEAILNQELLMNMLNSDNSDYQLFSLKRLSNSIYITEHLRIAEIFRNGIPLTRRYIIKNLPDSIWGEDNLQQAFWESFAYVDLNTRSLLLERIAQAPQSAIESISENFELLTQNQLKIYLDFLSNSEKFNSTVKSNLAKAADSKEYAYAYLISQFLNENY